MLMKTREILPLVGSVVQVVTIFGARVTGRLDGVGNGRFGGKLVRLGGGVRLARQRMDEERPARVETVALSVCQTIRPADAHEVEAWREADLHIAAAARGAVVVP